MKSTVETLEPTKVRLTVEADHEEIKPQMDKAYKEISKQANIPGFRKGHVPPRIIDRSAGLSASSMRWAAIQRSSVHRHGR